MQFQRNRHHRPASMVRALAGCLLGIVSGWTSAADTQPLAVGAWCAALVRQARDLHAGKPVERAILNYVLITLDKEC